ncbi:MAG: hypothetical protein RIB44_12100 [Lacipirellulaceae bacterium]
MQVPVEQSHSSHLQSAPQQQAAAVEEAATSVVQQGLPQLSPHLQPSQLQASQLQSVQVPVEQSHSSHLQSAPQQQASAAFASPSPACIELKAKPATATTATAPPMIKFLRVILRVSLGRSYR